MEIILHELTTLFKNVPAESISGAAEAICSHNRIFVYGAGRSGLMLKAFAMRLAQAGKTAYVVGETVTPALEEGDLLVLASASGSTASVCRFAGIAKEIGADLLIISAKADSALSGIHPVDILLPAPDKEDPSGSRQVMGSLFEQALLLLCDQIISLSPFSKEHMRRHHANLE